MDDATTPTPPLPHPEQPQPEQPARDGSRHFRRRLAAGIVAAALVTGTAGVGAGYAVGRSGRDPVQASGGTTYAPGQMQGQTQDGQDGDDPFGSSTQEGSQEGQLPSLPTVPGGLSQGQQQGTNQNTSVQDTTKASGSQLTGLVRIVTTMKYAGAQAAGTGMVLSSDGEVVTNHHVVEGATSVKVTVMSTGKSYTAEVVGTDAQDDVAVLQLEDASGLQTVSTDDDGIATGDAVTAVGDGNGTVDYLSAAAGKVIAEDQSITTQSEATTEGQRLTDLVEISSDVVSGYSGGATYDADGKVVGMTTAASTGTSDIVGYAIPIAKVLQIVDDLDSNVTGASYDYSRPAFLGIGLDDSSATVQGVYEGTPADDAGLEAGDTITRVGSTSVSTSDQVQAAVKGLAPGDSVAVTWRDSSGQTQTRSIMLIEGPVE